MFICFFVLSGALSHGVLWGRALPAVHNPPKVTVSRFTHHPFQAMWPPCAMPAPFVGTAREQGLCCDSWSGICSTAIQAQLTGQRDDLEKFD